MQWAVRVIYGAQYDAQQSISQAIVRFEAQSQWSASGLVKIDSGPKITCFKSTAKSNESPWLATSWWRLS